MFRRLSIASLAVALLATTSLPAQDVRQEGRATAVTRTAIEKVWESFPVFAKSGDAMRLAALYSPDAIIVDPIMPTLAGRPAIENAFTDIFSKSKMLEMSRTPTSFEVYGNIALESGTYSQTWQDQGKAPASFTARYTAVWKRVEGRWLLHRDITTPLPPTR